MLAAYSCMISAKSSYFNGKFCRFYSQHMTFPNSKPPCVLIFLYRSFLPIDIQIQNGNEAKEMMQLKAKLDVQVEFRHAIAENPTMFYEQYILGKISLDKFNVKQQKLRQATEDQKAIELEIKECERAYNRFSHLFVGAIGRAYTTLYSQKLSIKDELELLL